MAIDDIADSGPTGNTGEIESGATGISAAIERAQASMQDETDIADNAAIAAKTAKTKTIDTDPAEGNPATRDATKEADGNAKLDAPQHWSAEQRQAFAGLAPDAQKAVLALSKDLQGGYTKRSMELSDKAKYADSISGLLADDATRGQLSQAGLDEVGYVRYLHSIQKFATSDPARYIGWAMQNLGVSPEQMGFSPRGVQQGQQQSQSQGDTELDDLLMDPALKQLRQEFGRLSESNQQLQARLQAEDSRRQHYQHQQQQAAQQSLVSAWNEFRSALDDHGQLAHPHADTLMQQMGAIMETDPEISTMRDGPEKLSAAYDAATWARPSLRTTRLDSERARADAEAQKTRDAERAKRSAGPRRASGAPVVPEKRGGIAGAIAAAQARLGQG